MILPLKPPSEPLELTLRINTFGIKNKDCMRKRSPKSDPKLNTEEGSTATMAMRKFCLLQNLANA